MKKYYIILLVAILFSVITMAQETQKNFINYQGVARNSENTLMEQETLEIGIALKFGRANATAVYAENHTVTTDTNGVFSLLIGDGSPVIGDYNSLPWGSKATFVAVSINGNEIGITEMMAVPYAITSGDGDNQSADEVPYANATSGLTAITTQDAIDELATGGILDADADPNNEIQTISFDGTTNELSLTDGGTVTLPSGGTDADADPENELQTLAFDPGTNALTLSDGNSVTIPSGGTDADPDPTNEIQTIRFDAGTNELSLSDGGTVTIPSGGTDADSDPTNEIDVTAENGILLGNGTTVSGLVGTADGQVAKWNNTTNSWEAGTDDGGGGSSIWTQTGTDIRYNEGDVFMGDNLTIGLSRFDLPAATLSVDGNIRSADLEGGGNIVADANGNLVLGAGGGGSSLWTQNGSDINYTGGRVGIGTGSASSNAVLEVAGGANSEGILNVKDTEIVGYNLAIDGFGIQGRFDGANSSLSLNRNGGSIYMGSNVGIGLRFPDSPVAALDVDGNIRSRDLSGGGNVIADADGNLIIGAGGGGGSLWTPDLLGINYGTGNVGIGIAASSAPLSVDTNQGLAMTLTSSTQENYVTFSNSGGYVGYSGAFSGANDMDFGTGNTNSTGKVHLTTAASPKLTVVAIGDVGIGTQDPTAKMHVLHDSGLTSPQLRLEESAVDYARLEFKNQDTGYWHIAGRGGDAVDVSRLNFYHHDGTIGRDYMTIAGSGNVGVGTTSPVSKLDVAGDINTSGEVHGTATGNANLVPIAYGTIAADGRILNGTFNFSVDKNDVFDGNYSISLNVGRFEKALHTVNVTRLTQTSGHGFISAAINPSSSSIRNTLIVRTADTFGNRVDTGFSFIVYRP